MFNFVYPCPASAYPNSPVEAGITVTVEQKVEPAKEQRNSRLGPYSSHRLLGSLKDIHIDGLSKGRVVEIIASRGIQSTRAGIQRR